MSREQDRDPYRLLRTDNAMSSDFEPNSARYRASESNSRTVSSSYRDIVSGNVPGKLDIFSRSSKRNVRDMPIFVEDTQESDQLNNSRSFNSAISSALEALQSYGRVAQSPSHSPMQTDWSVDFHKNLSSSKILPTFSTGMFKSEGPYAQIHTVESPSRLITETPTCKPFNDLNLKNIDEEDEFLYGDSNSLPEMQKSFNDDNNEGNVKFECRTTWSDEEDLFGKSTNTSVGKLKPDLVKSSSIWNIQNKNIGSQLPEKKHEENMSSSASRKILPETFSTAALHPSTSSTEYQTIKSLSSNRSTAENVVPGKDFKVISTSEVKSKYHVAAQLLRKQAMEKSKNLVNQTGGSSSLNDPGSISEPCNSGESKLTPKVNISVKDSKALKTRKSPGKNVKQLPKAFLQKNLDGMKDYIKGPQRKRVHSREELEKEMKLSRLENYRDLSPQRHHSPYESLRHRSPVNEYRHRSPVNEYRHRSPHHSRPRSPIREVRYRSPPYHSKRKSPHRDYERLSYEHSPRYYDGHRHSRSPGRERSPSNNKYRARSPGLHRSRERSRSPGYYRSRDRSYERKYKKESYKLREVSHKGDSERYQPQKIKKSQNYSSDDSFCSLSLESKSVSSDSSDDISEEKEKSSNKSLPKAKIPEDKKIVKGDCSEVENKAVENTCVKSSDTPSLLGDVSQNLANICKFPEKAAKDVELSNDIFKPFNKVEEDEIANILKLFKNNELISELVEGVQEHSSAITSSAPSFVDVTHNINNLPTPPGFSVPSMSYPALSCPQSYPAVPPVPVPFHPVHQINTLPPLTFPPPSVPARPLLTVPPPAVPPPVVSPASVYGPFPVSIPPPVDHCRTVETIQMPKKRPTTLRSISITQSVDRKDMSAKSESKKDALPSAANPTESTENIVVKEKVMNKKLMSNDKTTADSVAGQNKLLIEKFKKLKTERHVAHVRVNASVDDMLEMRKMMDDTWGKKINASERVFHSKCKHLLSISSEAMSHYLKEAKRLDEELSQLKNKLPDELQLEVANIKVEVPKKDDSLEFYSCYDAGNHTCYLCGKQFSNIQAILDHLQSPTHKERMTSYDKAWIKDLQKTEEKEDTRKSVLEAVLGVEFVKPFTGFHCALCSESLIDKVHAEQHLKSHDHHAQYKDYIKKHPLYERKLLFQKYIQYTALTKERKKKELLQKEVLLSNRKKVEAADEKVKEKIRDQKSKEKVLEELEEVDDSESPASKNVNLAGIKLTLSGEKELIKETEKEKGAKVSAVKPGQKLVFIGKAPNFKARPKPWYKRDIYHNNTESTSATTTLSNPTVTISKIQEKITVPVVESLTLVNEAEISIKTDQTFLGQGIAETVKKRQKNTVKKSVEYTCLTEEESKNLDTGNSVVPTTEKGLIVSTNQVKSHESKTLKKQPNSLRKDDDLNNQPESSMNKNKGQSMPVTKNPVVNQAIKNILLGTDSSMHQDIPLTEIQLPEIPIQSSSTSSANSMFQGESNIPLPMEIDDAIPDKSGIPDKSDGIPDKSDGIPDKSGIPSDSDSCRKLMTEEDRDFYILGINKDDWKPLVVPVPPPSSLLNCGSPSHVPTFSPSKVTCNSPKDNINQDTSGSMGIPVSISTHLNKSPNFKKQNVDKSNKSNLITIVPSDDLFQPESFIKSDDLKTDVTAGEVSEPFVKSESSESQDENNKVAITEFCITSQNVNIDSSVEKLINREQKEILKSVSTLEITETLSLEINGLKSVSVNAPNSVCESAQYAETLNARPFGDDDDINAKEEITKASVSDVCHVETVLQEEPSDTNQTALTNDGVMLEAKQIHDNPSVSKSESCDSSVRVDKSVDINVETPVFKDCEEKVLSSNFKTFEVSKNSSVNNVSEQMAAPTSTEQSVISTVSESVPVCNAGSILPVDFPEILSVIEGSIGSEVKGQQCGKSEQETISEIPSNTDLLDISDMKVCPSIESDQETLQTDGPQCDIKSLNDLSYEQQLNLKSNKESILGIEVCASTHKSLHMEDQQSTVESNQVLQTGQPLDHDSCKKSISDMEICVPSSKTIHTEEQQQSPTMLSQDLQTGQPVNQGSSIESTSDMEICASSPKTIDTEGQQQSDTEPNQDLQTEQPFDQDSSKESVCDMEICATIPETENLNQTQIVKSTSQKISAYNLRSSISRPSSFDVLSPENTDHEVKEKGKEQQAVLIEMTQIDTKSNKAILSVQPSNSDSCKESIYDKIKHLSVPESVDIREKKPTDNTSEKISPSNSESNSKEGVSEFVNSADSVAMIITPKCEDVLIEASQGNIKPDKELTPLQPLNQDLGMEISSDFASEYVSVCSMDTTPKDISDHACSDSEVEVKEFSTQQQTVQIEEDRSKSSSKDSLSEYCDSVDLQTGQPSDQESSKDSICTTIPEPENLNRKKIVKNTTERISAYNLRSTISVQSSLSPEITDSQIKREKISEQHALKTKSKSTSKESLSEYSDSVDSQTGQPVYQESSKESICTTIPEPKILNETKIVKNNTPERISGYNLRSNISMQSSSDSLTLEITGHQIKRKNSKQQGVKTKSKSTSKESLPEYGNSVESVIMEITPHQADVLIEASQGNINPDKELTPLQPLNQDLEMESSSDFTSEETLPQCNAKSESIRKESLTAVPEVIVKTQDGDIEKTSFLPLISGEGSETQNLPKSDTDTDEYETEE